MPLIVLTTVVSASGNKKTFQKIKTTVFCPKCKNELHDRIHRAFFVKTFLFWLPLKRYMCYRCQRKIYKLD